MSATASDHVVDPAHSARSRAAMRKRWGPRRRVYLNQLPPSVADAIRALVDAAQNEQAAASGINEATAKPEVRRVRDDIPTL